MWFGEWCEWPQEKGLAKPALGLAYSRVRLSVPDQQEENGKGQLGVAGPVESKVAEASQEVVALHHAAGLGWGGWGFQRLHFCTPLWLICTPLWLIFLQPQSATPQEARATVYSFSGLPALVPHCSTHTHTKFVCSLRWAHRALPTTEAPPHA